jgi:hypothetical protein
MAPLAGRKDVKGEKPVAITVEMVAMICGQCGISFEMPEQLQKDRRENGGDFYCPNGHARVYVEPEVVKLTRLLEAERRKHEETQRALAETRNTMTKLEKRIANGVCPCCRRSFKQLAAHMKKKHPDYVAVASCQRLT